MNRFSVSILKTRVLYGCAELKKNILKKKFNSKVFSKHMTEDPAVIRAKCYFMCAVVGTSYIVY